ncbi:MAG: DUF11 domain-containing protein [Trueperaceae bacterium]|nr:DUF11 domain-containing protein [Trueperaceae bacterium]
MSYSFHSRYIQQRIFGLLLFLTATLANWASAEGSAQINSATYGLNQPLYEYNASSSLLSSSTHPLYVILDSASSVINVSLCAEDTSGTSKDDIYFEVWATTQTGGKYGPSGSSPIYTAPVRPDGTTEAAACTFGASTTSLNPPSNYRWAPIDNGRTAGVYEIRLHNNNNDTFLQFDISVTPNKSTNPNPNLAAGRLFAYNWAFDAGNYGQAQSTDANYYVLVPGGHSNTNYVWQLDLQSFAGYIYDIIANALGVVETSSGQNVGYSVPYTGHGLNELYPIYLGYPANAQPEPLTPPSISNYRFLDNSGIDQTISPGSTTSIQDSGTFLFTSDIPGTAQVIIDANQDGIFGNTAFGIDDIYLYDLVVAGNNSITWDGRDNDGTILPDGSYDAQLQVRIGEYHFVAGDAETSGGGSNNGLTIYRASSSTSLFSTPVFWDDLTGFDPDISGNGGSNLPSGTNSIVGASTGSFRHTWGSFSSNSFGNENWVDTYTYGLSSYATTPAVIETVLPDTPSNLGIAKHASVSGNQITLDFYLENFSGSTITNLNLSDNLNSSFGAGNYSIMSKTIVSSSSGSSLTLNSSYNGSSVTNLLNSSSSLAAFGSAQIRMVVNLTTITDQGYGTGNYYNSATLSGQTPSGTTASDTSTDSTDPDVDPVNSSGTADGGSGSNDNNNLPTDNTNPTYISINTYDYGDAPDSAAGTSTGNYQTLRSDSGPRHILGSGLYLGSAVSTDSNGFVDGIDNSLNASDDSDDGVSLDGSSLQGQNLGRGLSHSLSVAVTGSGFLNAWIDWNQDGDFLDAGEQIATNLSPSAGTITVPLTVPATASLGASYARFRYSSSSGLSPTGDAPDGEVEDYQINLILPYDYGDAPDTTSGTGTGNYQTRSSDNGAYHRINPQLLLGSLSDGDDGTLQSSSANADDSTDTNDEDGISNFPTLTSSSTSYNVNVSVTNTSSASAYLVAWIDRNKDGDFLDSGERSSIVTVSAGTTNGTKTLSWTGLTGLSSGTTYMRVRLSADPSFGSSPVPSGYGGEGEVEDYSLTILSASLICPAGSSLVSLTSYASGVYSTSGNNLSSNYALGAPDAVGGYTYYTSNAAVFWYGGILTLDLGYTLPANSTVTLVMAKYNSFASDVTVTASLNASSWSGSSSYTPTITNTSQSFSYTIPGGGARYLRFSSTGSSIVQLDGLSYSQVCISYDYGDAPFSYGDAYHSTSGSYRLGSISPDAESSSLNSSSGGTDGTGDDLNGSDDEDGLSFGNFTAGQSATVSVEISGSAGYLNAWIDWNKDGDFNDPGEQVANNVQDNGPTDTNAATGTIGLSLNVPNSVTTGTSYGRFRWSSSAGLTATGAASDGEVEDYSFNFIGSADLSILKTIDTSPTGIINDADNSGNVTPGDTVQFSLSISNSNAPSSNITVTDIVPAGYSYVPASIAGGDFRNDSNPSTTGLSWTISSMANPSSQTLSFQAVVLDNASPGQYQNTATVTATSPDSNSSNNSSSVTPDILRIVKYVCNESLQVDSSCDVGTPNASDPADDFEFSVNGSPGDTLVYRIEYHNYATTVVNFDFSDAVPVFTTLVEDSFSSNAEAHVICHANGANTNALLDLGAVTTVTADITDASVCDGAILPGESGAVLFKAKIK